jgi:hypothetical protein
MKYIAPKKKEQRKLVLHIIFGNIEKFKMMQNKFIF